MPEISTVAPEVRAAINAPSQAELTAAADAAKARANHTGTQAQSTVTNLTTDLAAKAPLASPAFTGTPTGITKAHVGLGNVDNTADTAKPVSTAQQTALNLKANLASPTFTGTVSGVTKAMVGLGNVDNTSDASKPISTATQAALDDKLGQVTLADLPAGTTVSVTWNGSAYTYAGSTISARPTSRTDITVFAIGGTAEPSWLIAGDLWLEDAA